MGWCDDPSSIQYNKIINYPYKHSSEKLWRKENVYDIIIVIDYNLNPIVKNKGSAIFLHLTSDYKKTEGCVAIKKTDMLVLLKLVNNKTKININ